MLGRQRPSITSPPCCMPAGRGPLFERALAIREGARPRSSPHGGESQQPRLSASEQRLAGARARFLFSKPFLRLILLCSGKLQNSGRIAHDRSPRQLLAHDVLDIFERRLATWIASIENEGAVMR